MILNTSNGVKKFVRNKDIKEVHEYKDTRYPSINTQVFLYDGTIYDCSNIFVDIVKFLNEVTVERSEIEP